MNTLILLKFTYLQCEALEVEFTNQQSFNIQFFILQKCFVSNLLN